MAYQPFTIVDGNGGYSKLNSPLATHSGSVTCYSGACYVRLLKTPTVTASGANNAMANLPSGTFSNGWAYVPAGSSLSFGAERVLGASQADTEPVSQIDIYFSDSGTATCIQH